MNLFWTSLLMLFFIHSNSALCSDRVLRVKANAKPITKPKGATLVFNNDTWVSGDSPIKLRLEVSATVDDNPAKVIYSSHKDFSSGGWVFLDPFSPRTSLAVDADDRGWNKLVEKFNIKYGIPDTLRDHFDEELFEQFMADLNKFIRENDDYIDNLCTRITDKYGHECRHRATFLAILFSKITKTNNLSFRTSIRVASGNVIKPNHGVGEGHVWNLVTVEIDEEKFYWIDDPEHRSTILLNPTLKSNMFIRRNTTDDHNPRFLPVTPSSWWNDICQLTIDKFSIVERKNNMYSKENVAAFTNYCENVFSRHSKHKITRRNVVVKRKRAEDEDRNQPPTTKRRLFE